MVHRLGAFPPPRRLPEGYGIRTATSNDAARLAVLLSHAFLEEWDESRVRSLLLDHPDVPVTLVVDFDERIVATASYQVFPRDFPDSGWVHYVGADPAHAGIGLGYSITRAVLAESVNRRKTDVRLTTDDWRLSAIRTYLNLGFEPDLWHESHKDRWSAVLSELRT
jgi:mycothiol synthase